MNISNVNIFELQPHNGRKSFYGKCQVLEDEKHKKYYLKSYNTIVASFDKKKKIFRKHWDGYSHTTQAHINSFLRYCGISESGKKYWDSLKYIPLD